MDPMIAEMMIRQRHAELFECGRQSRPGYERRDANWLRLDKRAEHASGAGLLSLPARLFARLSAPRHAAQW
ncbi:MAG TPA: hypothetical protein VFU72_00730 [Nitrolancea sp.]|nr:hypothetical protein [Nitrolancea sp.]